MYRKAWVARMWVSSGVLLLMLAAACLLALACFQAREVFRGGEEWPRELRRYRHAALSHIPRRERLSISARLRGMVERLNSEKAQWHDAVEGLTDQRDVFEHRVRVEIDRLVGKEDYHGQKEQL